MNVKYLTQVKYYRAHLFHRSQLQNSRAIPLNIRKTKVSLMCKLCESAVSWLQLGTADGFTADEHHLFNIAAGRMDAPVLLCYCCFLLAVMLQLL